MRLPGKAIGAFVAILASSGAALAAADVPAPGLLGSVEYGGDYLPQWTRLLERLKDDEALFDRCESTPETCPSQLIRAWIAELDELRGRGPHARIEAVNRIINARPYRADAANYGLGDYWATPLEFLANSGDCEDYAVFKFFLLRRLGFANDALRIVFVREGGPWVSHAVLAVYLDDDVYILDNQAEDVLPEERVSGYAPLYSVNETMRWAHYAPPRAVAPARPLTPAAGS